MTTYFITTGVSASRSARCWKLGANKEEEDKALKETALPADCYKRFQRATDAFALGIGERETARYLYLTRALRKRAMESLGDTYDTAMKQVDSVIDTHMNTYCWNEDFHHLLPAELSTLYMMFERTPRLIGDQDNLVFLLGGTNIADGVFCRRVMQRIAKERKLLADPEKQITCLPTEHGFAWDPVNNEHFWDAMEQLWLLIERRDARYVLTGGYKGVLMAISFLLAHSEKPPTCVYYLHEDGKDLIAFETQSAIRINQRNVCK